MIYFKSKSIIVLCLFVFITIHDSYGVQTGTDKVTCMRVLKEKGYVESSAGPKSGLDLYLEFFDELKISEASQPYDKGIEKKVITCSLYTPNQDFDFENFFNCDVLVHAYFLVEIENAEVWCQGKGEHHDIVAGTVNNEEGCREELRLAGFTFKHGLDNYAYLVQKERKHEKIENLFSGDYTRFLRKEIKNKKHRLENAATWCYTNECDMALREAGFTDRYIGGNNRKELASYCDRLEGLTKRYCLYVQTAGSNFNGNDGLLGTHGWCLIHDPVVIESKNQSDE